ncbi:pilus assembly protein PilP [Ketobacter alkanivorans]|uniref:Pilus assembly protein PilP n=1 Tax=Ketobacter alkanivorans TaxID=1917421 RepID=A0A2K9LNE4_9GAMM|nr:pilus assembly protein PilP [Ketobacter alkanivorans]AUM13770.1 pilus assembly protein PilP [Ketobacter alkanivorans]
MRSVSFIGIALIGILMAGCGGDTQFTDIKKKMAEVKSRPKGRIEPPPEFKVYKAFSYSAAALRSPFDRPLEVEMTALPQKRSNVKPDFNRPKEVLEQFGIDSLGMVGTLSRPGASLFALVKDPDNGLHRVKEGNYLGRNFGKITAITPSRVDVIEIVSDGQDGWVERPRTLVLRED